MMIRFLKKIIIFIIIGVIFLTLLLSYYGGYLDYFYEKFTTAKQYSFILGDSRAMQGIQPKVLDSCLQKSKYKLPTYNFSFTIAQIAYGPSYLSAIKRKLDTTVYNQLFIVSVNPWMLANREPRLANESDALFLKSPPHNMEIMNVSPNFEYIIKNFNYFHFKAVFRKNSKLHKDGWLEENNLPTSKKIFEEWKANQILMFNSWVTKWEISNFRIRWLSNSIAYLKKYGTVVLIRMPIDNEILFVETAFWKDFDVDINKLSVQHDIVYFNFSGKNEWKTYDGHHLDKFGGKLFSVKLSEEIKKQL
tara:strand:- start:72 stop:986 length:915 start_codon:yes stop_codon:yes gene_type:complete